MMVASNVMVKRAQHGIARKLSLCMKLSLPRWQAPSILDTQKRYNSVMGRIPKHEWKAIY